MSSPRYKHDLVGKRFGRLTVMFRGQTTHNRKTTWVCRCDCGTERQYRQASLLRGYGRSCGCLKSDETKKRLTTHGRTKTPEYQTWLGMIKRCEDRNEPGYQNYGGRGIKICALWRASFSTFLKDMGERPTPKHSIDRIDVNGDYKPSNCRWATRIEQANNKQNTRRFSFDGRSLTIREWSHATGITVQALRQRALAGWSVERMLTTPNVFNRIKP